MKNKSKPTPHKMEWESHVNLRKLVSGILLDLGTPLSADIGLALVSGNDRYVANASIDPSNYASANAFRDDYFAVNLLRKYPGLKLGYDPRRQALDNFLASENLCALTNKRITHDLPMSGSLVSSLTPQSLISSAREKIRSVLGDFSWNECSEHFSFGKGATFSLPRRNGDEYYKIGESQPSCTWDLRYHALAAVRMAPRWYDILTRDVPDEYKDDYAYIASSVFRFVPGNRIDFVPKNAKTDRTIAIEPTMNGYIQRGIGVVIRKRLKRVKVDLLDQTNNQRASRWGSITGLLATVDLSMASDTLSLALVKELLPQDWFDAINVSRSSCGVLPDDSLIHYQKVSSMGNGFTFELESLIFWALSQTSVDVVSRRKRRVRVYGDDIIVPTGAVPTLRFILEYCGFSFNSEKSFWSGPFRESCGKHHFNGTDVTPVFIDDYVDTNRRVVWLANQLRRWSRMYWGLDGRIEPTYRSLVSTLPHPLCVPRIADGYGDVALFGDFDEVTPRFNVALQSYGFKVDTPSRSLTDRGRDALLVKALRRAESYKDFSLSLLIQREFSSVHKTKWDLPYAVTGTGYLHPAKQEQWRRPAKVTVVRDWPNYGPWLNRG